MSTWCPRDVGVTLQGLWQMASRLRATADRRVTNGARDIAWHRVSRGISGTQSGYIWDYLGIHGYSMVFHCSLHFAAQPIGTALFRILFEVSTSPKVAIMVEIGFEYFWPPRAPMPWSFSDCGRKTKWLPQEYSNLGRTPGLSDEDLAVASDSPLISRRLRKGLCCFPTPCSEVSRGFDVWFGRPCSTAFCWTLKASLVWDCLSILSHGVEELEQNTNKLHFCVGSCSSVCCWSFNHFMWVTLPRLGARQPLAVAMDWRQFGTCNLQHSFNFFPIPRQIWYIRCIQMYSNVKMLSVNLETHNIRSMRVYFPHQLNQLWAFELFCIFLHLFCIFFAGSELPQLPILPFFQPLQCPAPCRIARVQREASKAQVAGRKDRKPQNSKPGSSVYFYYFLW